MQDEIDVDSVARTISEIDWQEKENDLKVIGKIIQDCPGRYLGPILTDIQEIQHTSWLNFGPGYKEIVNYLFAKYGRHKGFQIFMKFVFEYILNPKQAKRWS